MAGMIPGVVGRILTAVRNVAPAVTAGQTVMAGIAVSVIVVVGVTPLGQQMLRGLLQSAPPGLRGLPGVEAVTGVVPPKFAANVLGFRAPLDVAVSSDNAFLYVVEGSDTRDVKRVDLRDGTRTNLSAPGTTPGTRKPIAIALSSTGNVYVVDRLRYVVDIFDRDNRWLGSLADPPGVKTWEPLGVTVDEAGDVYVSSAGAEGPTVVSYARDGRMKEVFPRLAPNGVPVSFPSNITVGRIGDQPLVIVSDSNNRRVVVMSEGGRKQWTFGDAPGAGAIGLPRGLAMIRGDRCLVVDATDHSVTAWQLREDRAEFLFRMAGPGMEDGEFLFPNGIARTADGRLFLTDRDNDRVQVWR